MSDELEALVRAEVRAARAVRLALGALLILLAALAIAVAVAGADGTQRVELVVMFAIICGVPGALLVRSTLRLSHATHPLVAAVRARGAIAAVALGYERVGLGHRARIDIELSDGSRHRLEAPLGRERELVAALEALR